jgi:hypothetical protein
LERFADGYQSGYMLPELVRRLIHATTRVERLDMPAGDGGRRPGWDGRVLARAESHRVPEGLSVWEEKSIRSDKIKAKADEDYDKRTNTDSLGVDRARAVFIFVSLRRWDGKHAWENTKREGGPWRDVRVLDADNLEDWLDHAPQVARWFRAEHLKDKEARAELVEPWID